MSPGGPTPKPKPRGKPKPKPRMNENGRDKPLTKQMKEIQNGKRIILECKQALENLGSDECLEVVKPKILTALCEKVKTRLTPSLRSLYSQGYDPSDPASPTTPGMTCLESLRNYSRILLSVQESERLLGCLGFTAV